MKTVMRATKMIVEKVRYWKITEEGKGHAAHGPTQP